MTHEIANDSAPRTAIRYVELFARDYVAGAYVEQPDDGARISLPFEPRFTTRCLLWCYSRLTLSAAEVEAIKGCDVPGSLVRRCLFAGSKDRGQPVQHQRAGCTYEDVMSRCNVCACDR